MFVNGKPAGAGGGFQQAHPLELTHHLLPGNNVVAVAVVNAVESPAGLLGKVVVELDRRAIEKAIDAAWKTGDKSDAGWNTLEFNDAACRNAVVVGKRGEQPWGRVELKNADVLGCPLVRKEFTLDKPVRKRRSTPARWARSWCGSTAGRGQDYFSPGWTDYRKRVYYNAYDVTPLVRGGAANAIGGIVGAGWYAGAPAPTMPPMALAAPPRTRGNIVGVVVHPLAMVGPAGAEVVLADAAAVIHTWNVPSGRVERRTAHRLVERELFADQRAAEGVASCL